MDRYYICITKNTSSNGIYQIFKAIPHDNPAVSCNTIHIYIYYIIIAIERTRSLEGFETLRIGPPEEFLHPHAESNVLVLLYQNSNLSKWPTSAHTAAERHVEVFQVFVEIVWEIVHNLEYFKVDRKVRCPWLCKYPAHLQTNLYYH